MRWKDGRRSSNVEDRRGQQPARRGRMRMGGGGGGLKLGGCGTVIAILVAMYFGMDPSSVLQLVGGGGGGGGAQPMPQQQTQRPTGNDEGAQFVSAILADTEQTWGEIFQRAGKRYQQPKLVLFTDAVDSACGYNSAAVGPFYCPADQKAYIDLTFFDELHRKFGAPGDFAQAYVIAHEIGHHVQNLMGVSEQVHRQRRRASKAEGNHLSVLQELQADCFAGVWAHHAHTKRQMLEQGDVEEGIRAAQAIGDDTLQRRGGGRVQPEGWTHGSAEQRVRWFSIGMKSGDINQCDTFSAPRI